MTALKIRSGWRYFATTPSASHDLFGPFSGVRWPSPSFKAKCDAPTTIAFRDGRYLEGGTPACGRTPGPNCSCGICFFTGENWADAGRLKPRLLEVG